MSYVVVCRARRRVDGIASGRMDGVRATNVSSNASGHHADDGLTGLDGVERQNTARGRRATIRDRRRRRAYTADDDCTNVNHVVSAPLENARVNAEGGHETRRASGLSIPRGRCPRCDCSDVNGC